MFQNQNPGNNVGGPIDPTQSQAPPTYNGMQQHQQQQQQQQQANKSLRKKPFVKITEQPAGKALRFRYECEGRSAGSIPGVNSTPENKTFPTIEIVGYKGRAVVVVSCVTKDTPYRPHPHNLVGKEGCKKGVCTLEINSETMRAVFSNLGIQCVKKKDIEGALKAREEIRVDPYKTGFSHRFQASSIDLNSVRLCFQVFMESEQKGRFTQPLPPVVSEPIYDKKAMSDLVICRLCSCTSTVLGNAQIILLCEKVAKEDIAVRFFEEKNGQMVWEAFGEFQHTDVHKQTAIAFKTPRYHTIDITEPAKVFIQLRRPSDGVTSESLPFEYVPLDSGRPTFWQLRRNLKRKPDLDIFQQILSVDGAAKAASIEPSEVIDLNTPTTEQQDFSMAATLTPVSPATELESPLQHQQHLTEFEEAAKRRNEHEIDTIIDEKVRELEQQQQKELQSTVETAEALRPLTANDKINEWMKSNEFAQMDTQPAAPTADDVEPVKVAGQINVTTEEDKTLNDLLDQVAELDEIYTDHVLRRDTYHNTLLNELSDLEACLPDSDAMADGGDHAAMDIDENFDDAATYTSLQIAQLKNPIDIPMEDLMPPTPPASHLAPEDAQHYDHVEVLTNPSPNPLRQLKETQSNACAETTQAALQSPPRPAPPKFANSPHMHITAAEEEKLPPLPPKRLRKQDSNAENRSIEANNGGTLDRKSRNQTPIIIMRTPDHSPPTKRLPPTPGGGSSNTLPRQKKPGFFSKLFSRRKSKSDLQQTNSEQQSLIGSKAASPNASCDNSVANFSLNDPHRSSLRSAKSAGVSPTKSKSPQKTGKPVGRSVSSVSGKRPNHLNADVIHIPLKGGDSTSSLPHQEAYSNASTITLGNQLDRRTASALQLAEIPISDGNMELVAIADRQSLRNLCEGAFNVQLDPDVDLTEAEHFALYTSIPPQATVNPAHLRRKRQKTGGDPMHLLLQQQQQHHQDGRQATNMNCWNTPNIAAIKTEPRDSSPQPFAQYRAPPELTPSPQPLSPTNHNNYQNHNNINNNNNNNNTPSPFSIATVGTVGSTPNPHLISPNHHYNTGVGGTPGPAVGGVNQMPNASPMDMHEYAAYGQPQQQHQQHHQHAGHQQHYQTNPFADAGVNQWEEKYVPGTNINDNNMGSNANSNHFAMQNLLATAGNSGGNGGITHTQHWNLMQNQHHQQHHLQQQQQQLLQQQHPQQHPQQQQQYHQHPDAGNIAAAMPNNVAGASNTEHGLSNLLNFDSEQLVRINSEDQQMLRLNSEDLQISNLSIST